MIEEITVTYTDYGKEYVETFDPQDGLEIAVDGPSVIRIEPTDASPIQRKGEE